MAKQMTKPEQLVDSDRFSATSAKYEYSADDPIKMSAGDRFQRWPFAQRVAQIIATRKNPESLVIGINGAWGEGKTTVFHFIEEELRKHENVVVFRFNPWRFPDESRLIRDFFNSLAAALELSIVSGREKIGDFFGRYVSIPAALAGVGETAKAIGDLLSSVELEKIKDRVETILKDADKRIVVLMDDIDRLDKEEIQTVFRLVKLVADFKNTAYVLAFDAAMVASALQERYSSHDPDAGKNFLEKIIQVPLDLPHTPKAVLENFCFEIMEQVMGDSGIELTDNDMERLMLAFHRGLSIRLGTPRMAKRYGNILSFALPILKGEVNPVDLMLVEGIRVFYPKLYETIRDRPEIFLKSRRRHGEERADNEEAKKIIEGSLDMCTIQESKAAIDLVKRLFPRIEAVYGGASYSDSFEDGWAAQRLVASGPYFPRYFSYAIPEDQIGDRDLAALIGRLAEKRSAPVASELKALIGKKNADYVIGRLRLQSDYLDSQAAEVLAIAIAMDGSIYPNPRQVLSFTSPRSQAAMLVSDLVGRIALLVNSEKAVSVAKLAMEAAQPVEFACDIFTWLQIGKEDNRDSEDQRDQRGRVIRRQLPHSARHSLGLSLANRIKEILEIAPRTDNRDLVRLLALRATYETSGVTRDFIKRCNDNDGMFVLRLLDGMLPIAFALESGMTSKKMFEHEEYDRLIKFADPEMIKQALEKKFGPYEPTEQFPYFVDTTSDKRLADQFLWIHHHVGAVSNEATDREEGEPQKDSN